jgi:cytochrome c biogenesis protein CcmG, thiol:disulfide interchange protein DsbE
MGQLLFALSAGEPNFYGCQRAEQEAARDWLELNGNPFELNIIDDTGRYGIDLGVYGAPETFLVDAKGVIRFKHIGVINYRIWEDEIMPAIAAVKSGDHS